jgi:filamentous hemagglutinin family protein
MSNQIKVNSDTHRDRQSLSTLREQYTKRQIPSLILSVIGTLVLCQLAPLNSTTAQIAPDPTLGAERSVVSPNVNINGTPSDQIDGGAIRGTNLFHSFQEFNIGAGRGAYFTNPAGIENILSRVTGSNPSNILGTLGVLGNANLFLINPRGIVFGPNARLDMGGSFVASTASAINFGDGTSFSTLDSSTPLLLTINMPTGLQFRENPGTIQVDKGAELSVSKGETLALVGGSVSLDGARLLAPGGRVELGGVASPATVELDMNALDLRLSFLSDGTRGDVSLANQSVVKVSAEGGGSIAINARNLSMARGSELQAGIDVGLGSAKSIAGDIEINAQGAINLDSSSIANAVLTGAVGQGGEINITTESLSLTNGARLNSSTFGKGNAGNVNVNATGTVSLDGEGSDETFSGAFSTVQRSAKGNGGEINITTESLSLTNGARLNSSTFGQGDAGNVNVNARSTVSFDGEGSDGSRSGAFSNVQSPGRGNGGEVNITTDSLSVTNGARLGASTLGRGNAGDVNINAKSTVLFDGTRRDGASSGAFSRVDFEAKGNGGEVNITTGWLSVANGAELSSRSRGTGTAGNINVTANSLRLDNQATLSAETVAGQGNINLNSGDIVLRNGSNITTNATRLDPGGNITINTGVLVALEDSDISANAEESFGGRVTINAQGIFGTQFRQQDTPLSDITATSALGPSFSGIVQINTPGVDPSRGLVALPETVVDPASFIAQNPCQRGKGSAFVVTGRGGLPANPSEVLSSGAVQVGLVEPALINSSDRKTQTIHSDAPSIHNPIVPAQGWVFNDKGEVMLTAYNPDSTQAQRSWSNSAACRVP